jgi:hypothetical protein
MLVDGDIEPGVHSHAECPEAEGQGSGIKAYQQWRQQLELASHGQCYRCGLPQSMCLAIKGGGACEYYHILLPGVFILHQAGALAAMCQAKGFQGEYGEGGEGWQWQWLSETSERQFGERVLNWMLVWEEVRRQYCEIKGREE